MRNKVKFMFLSVITAALSTSCNMETPFGDVERGMGSLHLAADIKGQTVTRADIPSDEMKSLRENAVVYIERKNGDRHDVVRKYFGLDNIPSDIALNKGNSYLVEGWTGDSVSASFDAKFYRGKTENFSLDDRTTVVLKMNIANVLVSFAPETFELGLSDLTMTVGHSRGELTFSEDSEGGSTLYNTGYFMMPSTDNSLSYKISGKTPDGEVVTREGVISDVQRAHQYQIRLKGNDTPDWGAGLIKIEIEDIPVIEEEVEIFGRPVIEGVEFSMDDQIIGTPGTFTDKVVYVCAYGSLAKLTIGGPDAPDVIKNLPSQNVKEIERDLEKIGIHVVLEKDRDAATGKDLEICRFYFYKSFFDNLPEKATEYVIPICARDNNEQNPKETVANLRIANTESAIVVMAPVDAAPAPDPATYPMAITGSKATLTGYLYDAGAADYGMMYRQSGTSDWKKVSAKDASNSVRRRLRGMTRAQIATRAEKVPFTVTITGLTPGKTYEYKVYSDDYADGAVMTFTTESPYQIPNASFENWSTYSAVALGITKSIILPGAEGDKELSTWCSGNEGASAANKVLTDKSTDMVHSGQYSARLASDAAVGMIAAGNIFMGMYVETDGTNGVLSLGRPYNGSHPTKLKVWANYRPASGVTVKPGNEEFVPQGFSGGKDHGQIYVALTTEKVEIRTNPKKRKVFDAENDPTVLAYGQVTWTDDFGPEGALAEVEIPIEYKKAAQSQTPKYLIIVVSASKYGDFFSGAKGSVCYLDDFELIY